MSLLPVNEVQFCNMFYVNLADAAVSNDEREKPFERNKFNIENNSFHSLLFRIKGGLGSCVNSMTGHGFYRCT